MKRLPKDTLLLTVPSNVGLFQYIHHLKAITFPRLAEVQALLHCQLGTVPEPRIWRHPLHPCETSECLKWRIRSLSGQCYPASTPQGTISKGHAHCLLTEDILRGLYSPCRRAQWSGDKQLHRFQTGSPQFCLYPAVLHWQVFWSLNAYGTVNNRENVCEMMQTDLLVTFYRFYS